MYWGPFDASGGKADALKRHPNVLELSRGEMYLAACCNILRHSYGFVRATDENRPLDGEGRPVPLYTYPAIEFLAQFDYRDKTVFEFGAGNSTLFWMQRAQRVISVENDPAWFAALQPQLAANVELRLEQDDHYPFCIADYDHRFDVVVIDGAGYRYDCAEQAVSKLALGGLIILDNADWHPRSAERLRSAGLLQVDMTGFKPTEFHTSTTSLFFHREFAFATLEPRQPVHGMGAKRAHSSEWDRPYAQRPARP